MQFAQRTKCFSRGNETGGTTFISRSRILPKFAVRRIVKGGQRSKICFAAIQFKRGKGNKILLSRKRQLPSWIRQSQEFLRRCFHFFPQMAKEEEEWPECRSECARERERRKSIIIPLGMRTSLVTDNGSGDGGARGEGEEEEEE